jgi:flagellar biosynthesis/type III secretory pathway M-ring protein FliF/YscJ
VESLPFEATQNLEKSDPRTDLSKPGPVGPAPSAIEQLKKNPKILYGAGGGAVVVLGAVVFLFLRMKKKPAKATVEVHANTLPPGGADSNAPKADAREQWTPALGNSAMPALSPPRVEVLANQIRETAQKDAEAYAGVLRGWLKEGQI